jgi:hypothetical protein
LEPTARKGDDISMLGVRNRDVLADSHPCPDRSYTPKFSRTHDARSKGILPGVLVEHGGDPPFKRFRAIKKGKRILES